MADSTVNHNLPIDRLLFKLEELANQIADDCRVLGFTDNHDASYIRAAIEYIRNKEDFSKLKMGRLE